MKKKLSKLKVFLVWYVCGTIFMMVLMLFPGAAYVDPETDELTLHAVPSVVFVLASFIATFYIVKNRDKIRNVFPWFNLESKKQSYQSDEPRLSNEEILFGKRTKNDSNLSEIDRVDQMEGHEFEYWCADLLRTNGFVNVEVTRGSGDQGVDVLAEKDGIRYAIQCKCYHSDLGNKPIQEVNAGKTIYGCHVGAVMTNRYFTRGGKQAAEATHILLWDRDKLLEWIHSKETCKKDKPIWERDSL